MTKEEYLDSIHTAQKVSGQGAELDCDFAVTIDDTLVPPYQVGDLLAIRKEDNIMEGELGLFLIAGKPHIKTRIKNLLISLNPTVLPVKMSDDVETIGKVVGVLQSADEMTTVENK